MNICVFGDSITWGGYDPINGGWVTLLRNYLEKNFEDISLYNLGICSEASADLLKRLTIEAVPRKPEVIILAVGANDVRHKKGEGVSFDNFEKNIKELVSESKNFTNRIIVMAITPVDERLMMPRNKPPYNFRENKDINECNRILKEVANKERIIFIEIPNDFSMEDLEDGLHPNTNGHLKIFEKIKSIMEKFLSPE